MHVFVPQVSQIMHEDLRPDFLGDRLVSRFDMPGTGTPRWFHMDPPWFLKGQHSGGKDCTSPIFGMSWSLITLFLFNSWIGLRGLVLPNCVILWFASCKCQTKGGYHAHLKIHPRPSGLPTPQKNGLFVIMSSVKFATLNKNQLGAGAFFPKEFFQVAVSRGDVMH